VKAGALAVPLTYRIGLVLINAALMVEVQISLNSFAAALRALFQRGWDR
jgi:hypothetical protein